MPSLEVISHMHTYATRSRRRAELIEAAALEMSPLAHLMDSLPLVGAIVLVAGRQHSDLDELVRLLDDDLRDAQAEMEREAAIADAMSETEVSDDARN